MTLKTKLVIVTPDGTWVRAYELPIPPFVDLGIRLDVYEIFNVDSVVVGEFGYDVTCIGHLENLPAHDATPQKYQSLGFEEGIYP